MSGSVSFHAKVSVPPGEKPFLKKAELQGDFGVDAGSFTKTDTQQGLNSLSRGALGEKNPKPENDDPNPQNVLSNLEGHVVLNNGIATFSRSFLRHSRCLRTNARHLRFDQRENRSSRNVENRSRGFQDNSRYKSLMLKVLDPFFKNKPDGYLAPVKITGTYDHPQFGLDLGEPGTIAIRMQKGTYLACPAQAKQ